MIENNENLEDKQTEITGFATNLKENSTDETNYNILRAKFGELSMEINITCTDIQLNIIIFI